MIFARPPRGFKWLESAEVSARVASQVAKDPIFADIWCGLRDRLVMTGHREGTSIREGAGYFIFEPLIDPSAGLSRLLVMYQITGETLIVHSILFPEQNAP